MLLEGISVLCDDQRQVTLEVCPLIYTWKYVMQAQSSWLQHTCMHATTVYTSSILMYLTATYYLNQDGQMKNSIEDLYM